MHPTAVAPTIDEAVTLARGHIYAFLASTLADPLQPHFEQALDRRLQTVAVAAARLLASEAPASMELGPGEHQPGTLDLLPVTEALARPREALIREHQDLFGLLLGKTVIPYETEYCRQTLTFYRTQQLADIAGFYRAFGLESSSEAPERQDHLSVELEFMAHLIHKELFAAASPDPALQEKASLCSEAQREFFRTHLAWWVPAFAALLRHEASGPLYSALASALASFLPSERARLGIPPNRNLAEPLPEPSPAEEDSCCGGAACE
jgi:TorA maturation chaperone TorD